MGGQPILFSLVNGLLFGCMLLYILGGLLRIGDKPRLAAAEDCTIQVCWELQGILLHKAAVISHEGIAAVATAKDGQAVAAGEEIAVCLDRSIPAPAAGIYVRATDGLEQFDDLAPSMLTPAAVKYLLRTPPKASRSLGKIVTDHSWQLAALMDAASAEQLTAGKSLRLQLQTQPPVTVTADVLYISPAEDAQCAVLFRGTDYLADLIHLRQVAVSIPREAAQALRVPTAAVHKDDGGTYVNVYSASQAEKRYVEVLEAGEDYTILAKDTAAHSLRAGNRIIIGS